MRGLDLPSNARTVATGLLVCAACALGAGLGTVLRFPKIGTALAFPPYAVLTTALILAPPRRWWIYILAAAAGDFWPHATDASPSFAAMTELANVARAVVAAVGIRLFSGSGRNRLETLQEMTAFLVFAVILGPLAGACLGAGAVALHGGNYELAFRPWLLSNVLTGHTVLPIVLILVAGGREPWRRIPRRRLLEGSLLSVALLAAGGSVLFGPPAANTIFSVPLHAPMPILLWAAVRFGPLGMSASILAVSTLAIGGTLAGRGPFVTGAPATDLVHLQLFLFVRSVPLLLIAALIQEQRRTAEALRASQQQYRDVVEDQTELICRFKPDGTLTFVNTACSRSLGRSPAELLGRSVWSLLPREKALAADLGGLSPARPVATWERALLSSTGESRWEHWRIRALFDDGGRVVDYQAVGHDVTERKHAEEEHRLLEAQRIIAESLRDAARRKDEFLAGLAHELRNPLAPIVMAVEVLRELRTEEETVRWAREVIGRQTTQLARLVDDLLDISRITHGHIHLDLETLDLAQIVAHAIETSRPLLEAGQVELAVEMPPAPLFVRGDGLRVAQIISNLLNNAAKYTRPGGHVRLAASIEGTVIALRVTDTGIGIAPEMLDRVFEAFTQVDPARDAALGGLGLGLSLAKHLAEMHGGTITAHSDGAGRGSSFVVRLPSLPAGEVPAATAARAPIAAGDGRRVLVVDDSVDAADSLARFLRLQGYEVSVAHDGLTGLEAAQRLAPSVVFLDLAIPKMDGLEVARQLRRSSVTPRIVLVATTGYGQPEDRRRTAEAGFDHHLTKPVDPLAVQALLGTYRLPGP